MFSFGTLPWWGVFNFGTYPTMGRVQFSSERPKMKKTARIRLIAVVATLLSALVPSYAMAQDDSVWTRLYGANRYDTMASVVAEGFEASEWAVVATGESFPDALSASALAGSYGCPVILTSSGQLSNQAKEALKSLGVTKVQLMGGASALSDALEAEVRSMDIETTRVAGTTRAQTSVKAMEASRTANARSNTVIVVSGTSFADALSIGPWSYASSSPIILTDGDGTLSDEAIEAIHADAGISNVLIVGGQGVVRDFVREQLGPDYGYDRIGGEDRYETSMLVASWELGQGLSMSGMAFATGCDFPDALSGAALCGSKHSVLLLADQGLESTMRFAYDRRDLIDHGYILGGPNALAFSSPTQELGQPLSEANDKQLRLVNSAYQTPFAGAGWCAAWVQNVYENAGFGTWFGDACDLYDMYCTSSDPADLKVGMIVAVSTHPHTYLGSIYGHVGIYLGDGWIADNVSTIRYTPVSTWIEHYGATVPAKWGWLGNTSIA